MAEWAKELPLSGQTPLPGPVLIGDWSKALTYDACFLSLTTVWVHDLFGTKKLPLLYAGYSDFLQNKTCGESAGS